MRQLNNIGHLNKISNPVKRVLFLGYGRHQTKVIDALIDAGCEVHHTADMIDVKLQYDLIVSFGYRHVLKDKVIKGVGCPIFNLHISYLPFNKGAHPNFWSFYENTPAGVTIHLVDEGIDTGPIVYQRYVRFNEYEVTFYQTYGRLIKEVEILFIINIDNLLSGDWLAKPQMGKGTLHFSRDLPGEFSGWGSRIDNEVKRLRKISGISNG